MAAIVPPVDAIERPDKSLPHRFSQLFNLKLQDHWRRLCISCHRHHSGCPQDCCDWQHCQGRDHLWHDHWQRGSQSWGEHVDPRQIRSHVDWCRSAYNRCVERHRPKVLAAAGDHIGVQAANRVWIDSVELWSDRDHDKDYYDGLLDLTHGVYAASVTNSYLHDHWKGSLVGHSDSNESEDKAIQGSLVGHSDSNESEDKAIQVTYAFNKWQNLNSRTPSFRFGHGHIFNNYFVSNNDGINTRVGAELLVQNNVFESVGKPLYSTENGYANASGNDFGGASNTALTTSWSSVGYSYTLTATSSVKSYVNSNAGAKLSF
ncbi:hypothetical protein RSAG8_07634, partial [Rhizoctonia solani AG-8 WAC10335]